MDKQALSDERLMMLFIEKDDPEAFDILYRRYYERLVTFIQPWHKGTAEDLAQESFTRVIERRAAFDPERGTFKTWLFAIAYHQSMSTFRWWTRFQSALAEYAHNAPRSFNALTLAGLDDLLEDLSEHERAVAMLRADGFTLSEIASTLELSQSTVVRRLNAIRAKLREAPDGLTNPK